MKKHKDLDPGIVAKRDHELHPLAIRFIELDEKHADLGKTKNEAQEALVQAMNRKGRGTYVADGVDVKVSSSVRVKAKRTDTDGD
jgi:hypothetical protein